MVKSMLLLALGTLLVGHTTAGPSVASLGSSYSAGFGLTNSYGKLLADLLAQRTGRTATYDNFAVSGSNVTDIAQSQASKLAGKQYDVVLITAGGNDLNYVACLLLPSLSYCGSTINETDYVARFTRGLDATVENLGNATQVPIYVVTYTEAIGSDTGCSDDDEDCKLSTSQVTTAQELYNRVINWTLAAVTAWQAVASHKDYQLKVIPMQDYSSGRHDVDSCEPWINGAVSRADQGDGAPWHPNEAGAQFMAQAVFNDLYKLDSPPY